MTQPTTGTLLPTKAPKFLVKAILKPLIDDPVIIGKRIFKSMFKIRLLTTEAIDVPLVAPPTFALVGIIG